jgi:hypothetical protein
LKFFRGLFLLLVLVNLGFFAWGRGYLGGLETGREPQRMASQIAPEKLHLVTVASTAAPAAAAPAAATPALACRLVTGLPLAEVEAFKSELVGLLVEIGPAEGATSYWVHIPPLPNKAAVDKKAGELRGLGVKDFYVMQEEGTNQNAISLGLFKSEALATEFLQSLTKRGVRSARVEARPPRHGRAVVKGAGELIERRLPAVVAKLPGAAMTECP